MSRNSPFFYAMKPQNNNIIVIDGNNMMAMNAHAHSGLTGPDGTPTGAIFGTVKRVQSLLLKELPDEMSCGDVVFVMDDRRPKYRMELMPKYKAARDDRLDDEVYQAYRAQLDAVPDILSSMGVLVARSKGWEADDAIGAIVHDRSRRVHGTIISSDKDMLQFVHYGHHVYRTSEHRLYGANDVPKGYVLLRCLWGDPSDGIDGVPTIGEKRAAEIVAETVEASGKKNPGPRTMFEVYDGKWLERLKEHKPIVFRNWKLMNLRLTADEARSRLEVQDAKFRPKALRRKLRSYGFNSILSDFDSFSYILKVNDRRVHWHKDRN